MAQRAKTKRAKAKLPPRGRPPVEIPVEARAEIERLWAHGERPAAVAALRAATGGRGSESTLYRRLGDAGAVPAPPLAASSSASAPAPAPTPPAPAPASRPGPAAPPPPVSVEEQPLFVAGPALPAARLADLSALVARLPLAQQDQIVASLPLDLARVRAISGALGPYREAAAAVAQALRAVTV